MSGNNSRLDKKPEETKKPEGATAPVDLAGGTTDKLDELPGVDDPDSKPEESAKLEDSAIEDGITSVIYDETEYIDPQTGNTAVYTPTDEERVKYEITEGEVPAIFLGANKHGGHDMLVYYDQANELAFIKENVFPEKGFDTEVTGVWDWMD